MQTNGVCIFSENYSPIDAQKGWQKMQQSAQSHFADCSAAF